MKSNGCKLPKNKTGNRLLRCGDVKKEYQCSEDAGHAGLHHAHDMQDSCHKRWRPNKIINGVLVLAMGMAGCSGAAKRNKAMWDCVDRIPAVEMSDADRMFLVRGCLYIGRTK